MKMKEDTWSHKELAVGKHCYPWQMGPNSPRKHAKFLKELCFQGEPSPFAFVEPCFLNELKLICLEELCFRPIFPKQPNVFKELGPICL